MLRCITVWEFRSMVMAIMVRHVWMVRPMVMMVPMVMVASVCVWVVRIQAGMHRHFGQVMGRVRQVVVPLLVLKIACVAEVATQRCFVIHCRAPIVTFQAEDSSFLLDPLQKMAPVVVCQTHHCSPKPCRQIGRAHV